MIQRQKVVINQPRKKADGTVTLSLGTCLELSSEAYIELSKEAFNKEECYCILVSEEDYVDFIISEAQRLAEEPLEPFIDE